MRHLYFACLFVGVVVALLAAGEAALSAESAEPGPPRPPAEGQPPQRPPGPTPGGSETPVAPPAGPAQTGAGPTQPPAAGARQPDAGARQPGAGARDAAAEVIGKLLSARSSLGPIEAEFTWVVGPVGANQQALEGRISAVDATHYRVDFGLSGVAGASGNILLVPDGRWAYQFSSVPGQVGLRVDLVSLKQQVRDPAARVAYDPTGGALLEVLADRGYVTHEGDEELDGRRCAILSYEGRSFRSLGVPGGQANTDATVRTRLGYRYEDGLLAAEEELDSKGRFLSTYRLRTPHRFEPPADLLQVPESVHCIDMTKQLVRRLLYGPPPGVQPAGAAAPVS